MFKSGKRCGVTLVPDSDPVGSTSLSTSLIHFLFLPDPDENKHTNYLQIKN